MNKIKNFVPYVIALLIIVACFLCIGASQNFLPNYKGQTEEFEKSDMLSILYFDDFEYSNLSPWDKYNSAEVKKVKNTNKCSYANNLINALLNSYVANYDFDSYLDFSNYLEYSKDNRTYYIRDDVLLAGNGEEYCINAAFTKNTVLYFSCNPEKNKKISAEQIAEGYDTLNSDYQEYIKIQGDYSEYQSQVEFDEQQTNAFVSFLNNSKDFSNATQKMKIEPIADVLVDVINSGNNLGVTYNKEMYLTFANEKYRLVLIYDPLEFNFVGFSLNSIK